MKRILVDIETGETEILEEYDSPEDDVALKGFAKLLAERILSTQKDGLPIL